MCQTKPMGVMGQFLLPVVIEELERVKKLQYIFEYSTLTDLGKSQHVTVVLPVARVLLSKIRSQSATRIVGRNFILLCTPGRSSRPLSRNPQPKGIRKHAC
jgi:hypothetical protein